MVLYSVAVLFVIVWAGSVTCFCRLYLTCKYLWFFQVRFMQHDRIFVGNRHFSTLYFSLFSFNAAAEGIAYFRVRQQDSRGYSAVLTAWWYRYSSCFNCLYFVFAKCSCKREFTLLSCFSVTLCICMSLHAYSEEQTNDDDDDDDDELFGFNTLHQCVGRTDKQRYAAQT